VRRMKALVRLVKCFLVGVVRISQPIGVVWSYDLVPSTGRTGRLFWARDLGYVLDMEGFKRSIGRFMAFFLLYIWTWCKINLLGVET